MQACLGSIARSLLALILVITTFAAPAVSPSLAADGSTSRAFFLLTADNRIAGLTDALPNQAAPPVDIVGVDAGETIVGIDVRPQNGKLYGLGVNATADNATLYHINPQNGQATALSAPGQIAFVDAGGNPVDLPDPATTGYGVDFNPAVDRFRVVTGSGLNFRVNPNTGAPIDGNLNTSPNPDGINPDGSINGGTTTVDATAYTNNVANNGNITTQYTLDAASDSLYLQSPPNAGTQTLVNVVTLGGATLDFTAIGGFDIAAGVDAAASNQAVITGTAFAALTVGGSVGVYEIDLVNGQATLLGAPGDLTVRGLAVWEPQPLGNALSADGQSIVRFRLDTPGTTTTQALDLDGIQIGEQFVGIDARPQTGQLYGLGVDSTADTATLYLIDPQNGTFTAVGTPSSISFVDAGGGDVDLPDASVGYGIDFNPTVDRLRVTTGSGLNFRVNPNNGAPVDGNLNITPAPDGTNPDGPINGLPSGSTGVSAAAYTNAYAQPLTGGVTSQYTLDAASNALFIQTPPNTGTQTGTLPLTLGGAPLDFTDINGFDIPPGAAVSASGTSTTGNAYAALTVGGASGIYQIDLATGTAILSGTLGAGDSGAAGLVAWSDAPTAELTATTTVSESVGSVDVTITSTGGTAMVASYSVGGGSATAGDDYTPISGTVVLGGSAISQTISLPINDDTIAEGDETVQFHLFGASGVQQSLTITIQDDEPTVAFSAAEYSASEISGTAVLTVTLNQTVATTATVDFATSDETALAGVDYEAISGTLTFAPGETSQAITVTILGDAVIDAGETFSVTLSAPTNVGLGTPSSARVTISDDQPLPGVPAVAFSAANYTGSEASGSAVLTVTLSQTAATTATVDYATSDGTATAGSDYEAISGTLTFAPGEISKVITVTLLSDNVVEESESFTVDLSAPSNATLGTPSSATVTIDADEADFKLYLPIVRR